jgi:hypothetical protein
MASGVWRSPRATSRIIVQARGRQGHGNNSLEADEADERGIIRYATLDEFKAESQLCQ